MIGKEVFKEGYEAGLATANYNTANRCATTPDVFELAWGNSLAKSEGPSRISKANHGSFPKELEGLTNGEYEIYIGGGWVMPKGMLPEDWEWGIQNNNCPIHHYRLI